MDWVNSSGSVSRIRGSAKPADRDCRQAEIHHIAVPTDGVNRLELELVALRTAELKLDPVGDPSLSSSVPRRCRVVRSPDFTTPWGKTMRVTRMLSSENL